MLVPIPEIGCVGMTFHNGSGTSAARLTDVIPWQGSLLRHITACAVGLISQTQRDLFIYHLDRVYGVESFPTRRESSSASLGQNLRSF